MAMGESRPMRGLWAGMVLAVAGLSAQAMGQEAQRQEPPRLFAPVPAAQRAPVSAPPNVRAALDEPPVPLARPAPDIRATLHDDEPPAPIPRPVYEARISFPDGVSAQFDIAYASLPGFRPLTLDVYTPRASTNPMPMVLYVHGGGWNSGDSRHALSFADFPKALAALAARGYVVASLNYRLSQEARFPAALQDVKTAIRWLRSHAASYGGDVTRVAVWGASAGGQLAAMAGTACGVPRFQPQGSSMDAPSDCPEAVIDWFGPTDLETIATDSGKDGFAVARASTEEGAYLGCEPAACAPGVVRLASPLAFVSERSPPFLIQHGAADTTVSPRQSQKLYDALKGKGVPAELVIYPDVGHGFMRGSAPDAATVNQAMEKLVAFLSSTFPNKPVNRPVSPPIRRTVAN